MTAPTPVAPLVAAWQAALAAEYQAVFGYGIVQARLRTDAVDNPAFDIAQSSSDEHYALSQSIAEAMRAAAVTPDGPLADYPSLYPVESAKDAQALAIRLEDDCSNAWRALYAACAPQAPPNAHVAAPPADLRASAQKQLNASAVRATRWRKRAGVVPLTHPFPGL
jgi:hypothetical protein